jgi:hypothetical protein
MSSSVMHTFLVALFMLISSERVNLAAPSARQFCFPQTVGFLIDSRTHHWPAPLNKTFSGYSSYYRRFPVCLARAIGDLKILYCLVEMAKSENLVWWWHLTYFINVRLSMRSPTVYGKKFARIGSNKTVLGACSSRKHCVSEASE